MGGPGSGTWYRWDKRTRIEESRRIDIRYMHRQGWLYPGYRGSLAWKCGNRPSGSVDFRVELAGVVLTYRYRERGGAWQDVEQFVEVERTPCNFGGNRPWWLCPGCGRRVVILCGEGKLFACRHCYRLPYSSQSEGEVDGWIRKAESIQKRLGGSGPVVDWWPTKPKGMHWKTYEPLKAAFTKLDQEIASSLIDSLKAFQKK